MCTLALQSRLKQTDEDLFETVEHVIPNPMDVYSHRSAEPSTRTVGILGHDLGGRSRLGHVPAGATYRTVSESGRLVSPSERDHSVVWLVLAASCCIVIGWSQGKWRMIGGNGIPLEYLRCVLVWRMKLMRFYAIVLLVISVQCMFHVNGLSHCSSDKCLGFGAKIPLVDTAEEMWWVSPFVPKNCGFESCRVRQPDYTFTIVSIHLVLKRIMT